jgi:hypothetical protein
MGDGPVAAFLKSAGAPLAANTTYMYGDVLILIHRKSLRHG